MPIADMRLQLERLERHYRRALLERDPISFLDLAHTLRVWVDMKKAVDDLALECGIQLGLSNTLRSEEAKKVLRGTRYIYLPLGSGVPSPGVEVSGIRIINKALSAEEIRRLYEAGRAHATLTALSFTEWLASAVYYVPSDDPHPLLPISRETLIKRIANVLGASHPAGTEDAAEPDNRFDPHIRELHELVVAGYPATYYQLLEIAGEAIPALRKVVEAGLK